MGRRAQTYFQTGRGTKDMKSPEEGWIDEFTPKQLLLNVYLTQGIFIFLAIAIGFFFHVSFPWKVGFATSPAYLISAFATGIIMPLISINLERLLPDKYFDDGGINEKIFSSLSYGHIFVLTVLIAFSEEWLFRGVLQPLLGFGLTSIIFSLLHVRYIKKPFLFGMVTLLSFWLGYLYVWTDNVWVPFAAHFLIDFISGCWIANMHKKSLMNNENGV
jgi:uncharacterized protein